MPRLSKFVCLVLFAFQVSCSSAPSRVDEAELARRELAEEVNIGRGMAASILGRHPLVNDLPELSGYVRALGETVNARVGRPEISPKFAIIDLEAPNAFAAPGGFIFISRGLLRGLRSEDELVGVLAHEIAHVNERHVFRKVRAKKVSGTFILARLLSGGRGDMGQAVSRAVGEGLKLLLEQGLGPELEHEADVKGAEMAAVLGYRPRGLQEYLRRTFQDGKAEEPGTHPPLEARLKTLEDALSAGGIEALRRSVRLKSGVEEGRKVRFSEVMGASFRPTSPRRGKTPKEQR